MVSFYGGRKGSDFELVKSYATIEAMNQDANNLNYNSYVLVQDGNKVYKKTLGGMEFIANVFIEPISGDDNSVIRLSSYTAIGQHSSDPSYFSGNYNVDANGGLIAGDTLSQINYNGYYDSSEGRNLIGLQIPYPKIDLSAEARDISEIIEYIERDTTTNPSPFYYKYKIYIPQGQTFSNLRVVQPQGLVIYDPFTDEQKTFVNNNYIIVYDQTNGTITKTYYLGDYRFIDDISTTDSSITITDNNGITYTIGLKNINTITSDNGQLIISYTDGTSQSFDFVFPTEISYDDVTAEVSVSYNNNSSEVLYTANYIKNAIIDNESEHLFVQYSDPTFSLDKQVIGGQYSGWVDYGNIRGCGGILTGLNLTPAQILDYEQATTLSNDLIIHYLNAHYPQGLGTDAAEEVIGYLVDQNGDYITTEDGQRMVVRYTIPNFYLTLYGKTVTVGEDTESKTFWGFDYLKKTWYYLGIIASYSIMNCIEVYDDSTETGRANIDLLKNKLPVGGLYFEIAR